MWKVAVAIGVYALVIAGLWAVNGMLAGPSTTVLDVSYDPTRPLWRDLNQAFRTSYEEKTGQLLRLQQSHGGSSGQARAVIDGLDADVVTLALWSDVDALRQRGLIDPGWERRFPNRSLPYTSTIVFVVRRGNPKNIRDWNDLVRPSVQVITANPKTSGNGRLSFLAAWGAVRAEGGSEDDAREFVQELYERVPVIDTSARGATVTFAQRGLGDVHLTWENEAHLEVAEAQGQLEIVYPSRSIRAEPFVAVVDANVRRKGTQAVAEAYLNFLYSDEAQEIIARHRYRPANPAILEKYAVQLPPLELFPVTSFVRDWGEAHARFFADGGEFDQIYPGPNRKG
jgi:sulfate transport system substrate-binding protein